MATRFTWCNRSVPISSGFEFPYDELVVGYLCGSVAAAVPPLAVYGMSDRFGLGAGRGVPDLISLPLGNTAGTIDVCVDWLPCTCVDPPHARNGSSNIVLLHAKTSPAVPAGLWPAVLFD